MANDYKKDSLYVFGVVCANGVQDTWGDTLTKKDIKKLNSSYKNYEVDTNHNYLKNVGVSVVENYITTVPMIVRGKDVPAGSWVMGLLVWDETLKNGIRTGELDGYSLCSRPATPELMQKYINRNEPPNYRDFEDKDDLNPLFVSIVKGAGNGYEFEYTTYSAYIERGKKEENPMSENDYDKFMQFMEAVNTYIERRSPAEPQNNEEIDELKQELKETQEKFDEVLKQNAEDKKEFLDAINELKEQNEPVPQEPDTEPTEPQAPAEPADPVDPVDPIVNEPDSGIDVNRGKPSDFQTEGSVGKPEGNIVSVDKFFDDGFVPRNRGYGGLPL